MEDKEIIELFCSGDERAIKESEAQVRHKHKAFVLRDNRLSRGRQGVPERHPDVGVDERCNGQAG